ncbi:MAG: peptidylprolyl isomerase [Atopobiaceae bacterium]|nr:peptidylprolyl isomerase [Atopobiaceae bacterium]
MPSPITRRSFLGTSMGVLASLALYGCGGSNTIPASQIEDESATDKTDAVQEDAKQEASDTGVITEPLDNGYSSGIHHATIEVENYGTIKLELNATNTPITVSNFAQLVNDKFYDGLTFHRVIKGFMIQGGDPAGNGTGGSERNIKGEFIENGVKNVIQHKRGVISMARSNDMNSASSQFFIMHADADHLDGQYAAFGKVTEGMDVVDAIAENTPVQDSNGTVATADQPRIISIRMDD